MIGRLVVLCSCLTGCLFAWVPSQAQERETFSSGGYVSGHCDKGTNRASISVGFRSLEGPVSWDLSLVVLDGNTSLSNIDAKVQCDCYLLVLAKSFWGLYHGIGGALSLMDHSSGKEVRDNLRVGVVPVGVGLYGRSMGAFLEASVWEPYVVTWHGGKLLSSKGLRIRFGWLFAV